MLILELAQTNANNKCYTLANDFFAILGAAESFDSEQFVICSAGMHFLVFLVFGKFDVL